MLGGRSLRWLPSSGPPVVLLAQRPLNDALAGKACLPRQRSIHRGLRLHQQLPQRFRPLKALGMDLVNDLGCQQRSDDAVLVGRTGLAGVTTMPSAGVPWAQRLGLTMAREIGGVGVNAWPEASTCHSLNETSKDEPRWADVPKPARCAGTVASRRSENARQRVCRCRSVSNSPPPCQPMG